MSSDLHNYGIIGFTSDNVGIDRRIYTGLTSTDPVLNVSYNGGRVDVYLNGIKLVGDHSEMPSGTRDYTFTQTGQGSSIQLRTNVALVSADVVECVGYVGLGSNVVTSYNPTPANTDGGWNVFASISHTASDLVNVFLNGVLLDDSDYTLDASANTVTIGGATLTASDVVVIQVIGALDNSNFVPVGGGTFSGNVAYTGNIQVDDIVEKTSAHGVEIDGVTLKDGGGTFTGDVVIPDGGNIGSASDTDAISISSAGYVIDSARPYFWVRGDHGSEDIGNNNRFPFNQITTDNGNHWNTTGYYFTTPVAGLYFFTAQLYWYNNVDSIDVEIDSSDTSDSNLVSLGRIIYDPRGSDMIFHVRALCYLSANRRVSVRNKAGGNRSWYFNDAGRHTAFQGCLIG